MCMCVCVYVHVLEGEKRDNKAEKILEEIMSEITQF